MDKVYCPYCGKEMRLINQYPSSGFLFNCDECGATSPSGETVEEAYAIARCRPLQKTLTLEEVKKQVAVWVEWVWSYENISPAMYLCSDYRTMCFDEGFAKSYRLPKADYGKKWRCWATKPTDEERKAAKWE